MSARVVVAAAACCVSLAAHAAEGADETPLRIVKGVQGPAAAKAAEIFWNREDGASSTATDVAVLWRKALAPSGAQFNNSWGLSAGLSKSTLAKKRSDLRTAGAGFYSLWTPVRDGLWTIDGSLDALLEDDHEHRARGRAFAFDATGRGPLLFDPNLGKGEMGFEVRLDPSVGLYHRHVSSTDDATETPLGSHAGPYLAANLKIRWLWVFPTEDVPRFDRVSLDIAVRITRDAWTSGGYRDATWRYADVSLEYLLFGTPGGKGLKPRVYIARTTGTDRPANEPTKNKTSLGLKVSYGIK